MAAVFILLGIVAVLAIWFFNIYNGLVGLRNKVKNAWAQIDVQLKRRYDLIPNLVETVKGYARHEREVLYNVTKARNLAQQVAASGPAARAMVEGELSVLLSRLLIVPKHIPTSKPTRTSWRCRKNSPRPRIRSALPANSITTRWLDTITRSRCSLPTWWAA
jgi:LemA protein